MPRECRRLTEAEEKEQHRLYMATLAPVGPPVDVGNLLYCRAHRRPLIECHDNG